MTQASPSIDLAELDFDQMRENAHHAATLLKTLANDKRLMVLCALAQSEASVGQLNRLVPLSQSALSQHLGVLRRRGLVRTRRQSQTIYYSLADTDALKLILTLHDIFCD